MFIITAKLSRRRAAALAAVLLLVLALIALPRACRKSAEAPAIPAETNEQRLAYLTSLGWAVNDQPIETLSITLGETLEEPYLATTRSSASRASTSRANAGKRSRATPML